MVRAHIHAKASLVAAGCISRVVRTSVGVSVLLVAALCLAATQGSFRGKVVGGLEDGGRQKWLYVQGPKGTIRRVEISGARVSYGPDVKKKDRVANPVESLYEGVQVQVMASQDGSGEWKASAVTILEVVGRAARMRETSESHIQ